MLYIPLLRVSLLQLPGHYKSSLISRPNISQFQNLKIRRRRSLYNLETSILRFLYCVMFGLELTTHCSLKCLLPSPCFHPGRIFHNFKYPKKASVGSFKKRNFCATFPWSFLIKKKSWPGMFLSVLSKCVGEDISLTFLSEARLLRRDLS